MGWDPLESVPIPVLKVAQGDKPGPRRNPGEGGGEHSFLETAECFGPAQHNPHTLHPACLSHLLLLPPQSCL